MSARLIPQSEVGGAIVRRRFSSGGRNVLAGERMSAETLAALPTGNYHALVAAGHLSVWPKQETERFVIPRGAGTFDVVEGVKLTTHPVNKEDATAIVASGVN